MRRFLIMLQRHASCYKVIKMLNINRYPYNYSERVILAWAYMPVGIARIISKRSFEDDGLSATSEKWLHRLPSSDVVMGSTKDLAPRYPP